MEQHLAQRNNLSTDAGDAQCHNTIYFMKKLFLMAVLALSALSMSAQEDSKFTFKVGAGLSSFVGSDAEYEKNAFAYKVGVAYDWTLSENFSILPGLELVNKGTKEEGVDGTINLFYAQVPVLAAYKFNVGDDAKLVLKAGPYAAYGISGSDIEYEDGDTVNAFDLCERFNAGVMAGISYDFGQFTIGAEYSRGFTKAIKDAKFYNQAFGVTFGYKF